MIRAAGTTARRQAWMVIAGLTFILSLTLVADVAAVPRYAARYGQRCTLCHIDPTGGGQRTAYAAQILVPHELAAGLLTEEQIAALDPAIGRNLSVGADLRTLYLRSDREPEAQTYENFLQMQSAIHLTFQLTPRMVAHVTQGQSETREAYGLAYILPANGWLKSGRFVPNYGWRLADHTQSVREALGRMPPRDSDVGLELGLAPGPWQVTASLTNGAPGSAADGDDKLAATAQAVWRGRLRGVGLAFGASILDLDTSLGRRVDRGPFAYVTAGPWTWLGECDWSGVDPPGAGGERTAWVVSQEVTLRAARGVDLRATWDFVDPDLDRKSGARWRAGGGVEYFPYPFLAFHTMVRREERVAPSGGRPLAPGADIRDATWFELQVHLLY